MCGDCERPGECYRCDGTGRIAGVDCFHCDGSGRCSVCNPCYEPDGFVEPEEIEDEDEDEYVTDAF